MGQLNPTGSSDQNFSRSGYDSELSTGPVLDEWALRRTAGDISNNSNISRVCDSKTLDEETNALRLANEYNHIAETSKRNVLETDYNRRDNLARSSSNAEKPVTITTILMKVLTRNEVRNAKPTSTRWNYLHEWYILISSANRTCPKVLWKRMATQSLNLSI